MDIAELPEALAALARDLELRDDDPFTLRSRDAILLAKRVIEERMTAQEAVRVMGGTAADLAAVHADPERRWLEAAVSHPGPPASEEEGYDPARDLDDYRSSILERLDNELRFHGELMDIRRAVLGPDHHKVQISTVMAVSDLIRLAGKLGGQAGAAPRAALLRLASHLLPTFASDDAEMDSPVVDLEAFGIGRDDPEAKLLLEHMNLGSDDAGWPHFPSAYVIRGLSAYLLAVSKATRRAAMGMPAPAPTIDLLGFEAAPHAAKTPEEKRRVFEQFIPLTKGG